MFGARLLGVHMGSASKSATTRIGISLAIGVVAAASLGGILVNVANSYQARLAEAAAPAEMVTVMVANRDLYQGVVINESDLYATQMPAHMVQDGAYRSPEHIVGRVPRERILVDEVLREERMANADKGIGMNAIVPRGMRALSINLDGGDALAGLLEPTNYVDVLVTIEDPDDRDHVVTNTVLQSAYVLAVNSRLDSSQLDPDVEREQRRRFRPSVTLAVTPEDAQLLAQGSNQGTLTLALRHAQDPAIALTPGTSLQDVLGRYVEPTPAPIHSNPPQTEPVGNVVVVCRGTVCEDVTMPANNDDATRE